MPASPLVVSRSSYWDTPDLPESFLLVDSLGDEATIRHQETGVERVVPLSSLRWADDERHEALLALIQKKRISDAQAALEQDPLLDIHGTHEKPSMYWACYLPGPTPMLEQTVDWLQALGVDINQRFKGITPLGHALQEQEFDVARILFERGSELKDATLPDDHDVMGLAAKDASFASMGWILSRGFEPGCTMAHLDVLREDERTYDPVGYGSAMFSQGIELPLLHRAVLSQYDSPDDALAIFNHLIFQDPNWALTDASGNTALDVARKFHLDNAKLLGSLMAQMEANELTSNTSTDSPASSHRVRL
jgi:hypothetical protein